MITEQYQKYLRYFVYFVFFLFYAWLADHIPFTEDDWIWGSDTGIQHLLNATQNSRYAGNFFVVVMTRSRVLNMFIMGTVSCLIPYLIARIATEYTQHDGMQMCSFVFANILFFTAGSRIWSDTNGWIAGYANFVISSVFVLLCVAAWGSLLELELTHRKESVMSCIAMFFCSLIGQLFLENLAVVMMMLSVIALFVYYRRTHHISVKFFLMAVGSFIGLLIMFSSSLYTTLFQQGEVLNGYRQILFLSKSSIKEVVFSIVYQCARLAVRLGEENIGLTLSILVLLGIQLCSYPCVRSKRVWLLVNFLLGIYYVIILVRDTHYDSENFAAAIAAAVVNGIYVVVVGIELYFLYRRGERYAIGGMVLWCSALLTLLPLVLTSENGARLLYTFETLAILLVVVLGCQTFRSWPTGKLNKLLVTALAIALLLSVRFFVVYSANGTCEMQRRELIATAMRENEESIILPLFPYEKYASRATPKGQKALEEFKYFHNIPDGREVVFR